MKFSQCIVFMIGVMFVNCNASVQDCNNKIYSQIFSPNKKYKLVKFSRDCGATTRESTQLSLLKSDEALPDNKPGNLFISYGLVSESGLVEPIWVNDSLVSIDVNVDTSDIFKMVDRSDKIRVVYNLKK